MWMTTGGRWGQRLPSSSQPSQDSNGPSKGPAHIPQPPSSRTLRNVTRCCQGLTCWEKGGEAAQSRGLGRVEEQGGSGGKGSFPLYGLILFQLSGAKT